MPRGLTAEEMEKALDKTEAELKAIADAKVVLEGNQRQQNSYITKLEQERDALKAQIQTATTTLNEKPSAIDPALVKYFNKKMTQEIKENATKMIISRVSLDVYNILKPELDAFLDAYMKESNQSEEYILDAFALIYGRAMSDPTHEINKPTTPPEPAAPPQQGMTASQRLQEMARQMTVPNISPTDVSSSTDLPGGSSRVEPRNTDEALRKFRDSLSRVGANKFK